MDCKQVSLEQIPDERYVQKHNGQTLNADALVTGEVLWYCQFFKSFIAHIIGNPMCLYEKKYIWNIFPLIFYIFLVYLID